MRQIIIKRVGHQHVPEVVNAPYSEGAINTLRRLYPLYDVDWVEGSTYDRMIFSLRAKDLSEQFTVYVYVQN